MPIDLAALPIAWLAGVLSIASPCVWPLVPIVMASAADNGRSGPIFLSLGLSIAFAVAGVFLTYLLISLGLDAEQFRVFAAGMLVIVGLVLLIKPLSDWISLQLSKFGSRLHVSNVQANSSIGQFGVGVLLGLVWLPCVGPTLGAAIALASIGQDLGKAFIVMFAFGLGTAMALSAVALLSSRFLTALRPGILTNAVLIKKALGLLLLLLGLMVLTGIDKQLEILAVRYLPDWAVSL